MVFTMATLKKAATTSAPAPAPKIRLSADITDGGLARKSGDVFETNEATARWLEDNHYGVRVQDPVPDPS
jgi:hypothetical protein